MILLKTLSQSLDDELVWVERNSKLNCDDGYSYVDHPNLEISSFVLSEAVLPLLRLRHNFENLLAPGTDGNYGHEGLYSKPAAPIHGLRNS